MVRSEMRNRKRKLAIHGEKTSRNNNHSELRQLLQGKKKRFKQTFRRKKWESISKGMSNINIENTKETRWQIGKIFNFGKRKTHGAEAVSTEQFYKYFKQQNAIPLNNIQDPETNMETHSNERVECPIDYPITDEEFKAAINKLKENNSSGIDNTLNEVKGI